MKLNDSIAQVIPIQVRVYFCGSNTFMTEHFLYSPQIGTTFN